MRNRVGQSVLEGALLIIVVVAALLAMFKFLQAGAQGRIRQAADVFGGGEQYDSEGNTTCYDKNGNETDC